MFFEIKKLDRHSLIIISVLALFIKALYYSPNNSWFIGGDTLVYHLSRIEHWIQNKNVEYYPTKILWQLFYPPFCEYIILQMRLLSDTSYFSNLVQFFAMIGSLFAVSLILKQFGIKYKFQLLSSIIILSNSVGFWYITNSKNDYVVAFFLVSFIYFGLKLTEKKEVVPQDALFPALALGLGAFTKLTFYIYVLPFCVWFGIIYLYKLKLKSIEILVVFSVFWLSINSFYFTRNYNLTGSLFGDKVIQRGAGNEKLSFQNTISNILRNVGYQLRTPIGYYNEIIRKTVVKIHKVLKIDVDNPEATIPKKGFFINRQVPDYISYIFYLSVFLFIIFYRRLDRTRFNILIFVLSILSGFVIYSMLLQWQPHAHLFVPLYVCYSVVIIYVFKYFFSNNKTVLFFVLLAFVLLFTFLISGLVNEIRMIIPGDIFPGALDKFSTSDKEVIKKIYKFDEERNLFVAGRKIIGAERKEVFNILKKYGMDIYDMRFYNYSNYAKFIRDNKIKSIGIVLAEGNYWEYPLWWLIRANQNKIRIEWIEYPEYLKRTKNYDSNYKPEVIVCSYNYNDIDSLIKKYDIDRIVDLESLKLIVLK